MVVCGRGFRGMASQSDLDATLFGVSLPSLTILHLSAPGAWCALEEGEIDLVHVYICGLLPQITTNFFVHPRSLIYGSTPKNHYPDFNRPEITCSPQVLTRDPHLMRLLPKITASALPET